MMEKLRICILSPTSYDAPRLMSPREINHEGHEGTKSNSCYWTTRLIRSIESIFFFRAQQRICAHQPRASSCLRALRGDYVQGSILFVVPPEPAQRVRQNRAAVFAIVAFGAPFGFVVVFGEL